MKPLPGVNGLLQADFNSSAFVWRGQNPYQAQKSPPDEGAIRRADLHLYGSKLGGPGLSAGRRNPYLADQGEEGETNNP